MPKASKIELTFEDIYSKIEDSEYIIVHLRKTMKPYLLEIDTKKLIEMPEGYLDYDANRFKNRKRSWVDS